MGRLILRDGGEKPRGFGNFIVLQETERLLQTFVAFAGPLRNRLHRPANHLLHAGPRCRRIFFQHYFGQSGNLFIFPS